MSLLNYLKLQKIDSSSKDEVFDDKIQQDSITLKEPINETDLENYWNEVTTDIHKDPNWFNFSND